MGTTSKELGISCNGHDEQRAGYLVQWAQRAKGVALRAWQDDENDA
jgi:hypothetical protein